MNTNKSRYTELWELIKKDTALAQPLGISIAAHPELHRRIIRAVQNRKLKDTGYKFIRADAGKGNCRLVYKSVGNRVTFWLEQSIGIGDL